jgi:hypothetical protein
MDDVNPGKAPSGTRATGYGDILVHVWITHEDEDNVQSEGAIVADPRMPSVFMEQAARHLLVAAALGSGVDFNEAIDIIAANAKGTQGKTFRRE